MAYYQVPCSLSRGSGSRAAIRFDEVMVPRQLDVRSTVGRIWESRRGDGEAVVLFWEPGGCV